MGAICAVKRDVRLNDLDRRGHIDKYKRFRSRRFRNARKCKRDYRPKSGLIWLAIMTNGDEVGRLVVNIPVLNAGILLTLGKNAQSI